MSMGSDYYLEPYMVTDDVSEDDLMERVKTVLWGWCQYHCGEERLGPVLAESACARDYYKKITG